jgi:hypothetical protein
MTGTHWLVLAIGAGVLAAPARSGVRRLIQARRLLRWRRPSLEGLDDQPVAIRGEVRVMETLSVKGVGACLWHRRIVMGQTGGKYNFPFTMSDVSKKADFSIVVEGRPCSVQDPPTRVFGAHYRWRGAFATYWLPVVDHLTVLGRARRKGSRWEIVKDSKFGLIYSIHPAERTAVREILKAGLCLVVVGLGLLALYLFLVRIPNS